MQSTKPVPHDLLALVHKAAPAEARIVPLGWAYEAEDYNIAIVMPDGVTRERTRQIEERLTDAVMDWDETHDTYTITMVWQQHEIDRAGVK
jgi:hypothetical protein